MTVTRVRDDITIYTDDKDRLTRTIERNAGNKTSALETVGKITVDPATSRGAGPLLRTGPGGPRIAPDFNPQLPPELYKGPEAGAGSTPPTTGSADLGGGSKGPPKPGLDVTSDTKTYGPRESPIPLPTKDLGLEL